MADTAKEAAGVELAAEKGRAKKKKTEEEVATKPKRTRKAKVATEETKPEGATTGETTTKEDEYLTSIREQIENCKNELSTSIQLSIADEYNSIVKQQLARAERRRRWNNFFHDVVIIVVVFLAVYFWCCLVDAKYFDFMKTECERTNTCQAQEIEEAQIAGPIKDANWYLANYSYLYNDLQMDLNADDVAAYYIYSDDRKVSQIEANFLLSMAYNRADATVSADQQTTTVSNESMQRAFESVFGSLEYYEATDFEHGCLKFEYDRGNKAFVAQNQECDQSQRRRIIEKIEKIYEEGEAIYVITTAAIQDATEQTLYNFDNLFQPVALNADVDDLSLYSASLNRYQYQFKESEQGYSFSSITKLK